MIYSLFTLVVMSQYFKQRVGFYVSVDIVGFVQSER